MRSGGARWYGVGCAARAKRCHGCAQAPSQPLGRNLVARSSPPPVPTQQRYSAGAIGAAGASCVKRDTHPYAPRQRPRTRGRGPLGGAGSPGHHGPARGPTAPLWACVRRWAPRGCCGPLQRCWGAVWAPGAPEGTTATTRPYSAPVGLCAPEGTTGLLWPRTAPLRASWAPGATWPRNGRACPIWAPTAAPTAPLRAWHRAAPHPPNPSRVTHSGTRRRGHPRGPLRGEHGRWGGA